MDLPQSIICGAQRFGPVGQMNGAGLAFAPDRAPGPRIETQGPLPAPHSGIGTQGPFQPHALRLGLQGSVPPLPGFVRQDQALCYPKCSI